MRCIFAVSNGITIPTIVLVSWVKQLNLYIMPESVKSTENGVAIGETITNPVAPDAKLQEKQENDSLKVLVLLENHGLIMPSNPKPNFIKNSLSHSNSRNQTKFAPIYTGDLKYTFVGTDAVIKSVSGKEIQITQIVEKTSSESSAFFIGNQFYIKWLTPNGLYSGGHFARNMAKWKIVKANKTGLTYEIAVKLLKVNGLSEADITNMSAKPKAKK